MEIKLISFSGKGLLKAEQIARELESMGARYRCASFAPDKYIKENEDGRSEPLRESLGSWTEKSFAEADGIVFVCACGIAVRAIAPFVRSKTEDPAVIAVDELGRYVIPLLSGHVGGANELAEVISEAIGAQAAVTTATDINGRFSVDDFARKNNLAISDMTIAKKISAAALRGEKIGFFCDMRIYGEIPENLILKENADELSGGVPSEDAKKRSGGVPSENAENPQNNENTSNIPNAQNTENAANGIPKLNIYVGDRFDISAAGEAFRENTLLLTPRPYVLGMGCRRGKSMEELERAALEAAGEAGISMKKVGVLASIDLKKDEEGLRKLCRKYKLRPRFYSGEELASLKGDFSPSVFVSEVTGTDNVCERAAVMAAGGRLIVKKISGGGVTAAVAVIDKENMEVRFE